MGVYSEMAADLRDNVQDRSPAIQDAAELASRRADDRQQAEEEQAKALLSQMQQNADDSPSPSNLKADKKAEEDRKRQEHEQAETKRKAEWEARQRAKEEAEQAAWENAVAMSDDEVMAASMKRVGDDSERLTRRNMKQCVTEYIQTLCLEDVAFARNVMHPRKNMVNCFRYIKRRAFAKSYAACREKRRKMEGVIPQKPTLTGEMSVAQAVAFFLSDRRGELKASTVGRYEYVISHYIVPDLGTVMLHELTAEKLSAYFKRLQNRGLSNKTARDIGVLLKTIFKVVKKKCHCDCPGRDVELPAYRGKKIEVFSDHEIALLAQKILEAPDITGLCILLVLNTGLRLGEICALRKSDIDYRSGFLRIERSAARVRDASGTHLVVQSPKSGSSVRLVAIPNDMLELLKATTQSIQRDNYLLTNTDTPMEPRTLQYRYRKLLERCGIRYRNFHALRHTYATRCMENGVDIKSLSELLGHADVRTTLQTYIHSSLAHKRQAVQSICFLPMEGAGSVLIPSKIPSEISAITVPPSKTGTCFVNCI